MINLGTVMAEYRWATRQRMLDVAVNIGITFGTLAKLERGDHVSKEVKEAIIRWLWLEAKP